MLLELGFPLNVVSKKIGLIVAVDINYHVYIRHKIRLQ